MSHVIPPVQGAPCWVSLSTGDLEAAQRFYADVLGWEYRAGSLGEEFRVAMSGGVPVAGLAAVARTMQVRVEWTPFFAVEDADAAAARVGERSATVAVGPIRMGNGRTAMCADPAGATFGFWEGEVLRSWHVADRHPPARLELHTRDAFAMAIFYGEVFGWATESGRVEVDYQYDAVVVRVDGRTVATLLGGAIGEAPDPQVRPRWEVSFYVDDVDAVAKAAVSAGGRVATGPVDTPFGRAAGLRDPEGGLFTVAATGGDAGPEEAAAAGVVS